MTFSLAVRTVSRRAALFASLMRQLVPLHSSVVGLHVSADESISPNENACRAIDGALQSQCDWVLFLEDDAEPIFDFFGSVTRWMERHERPNVHIYPLGCQYAHCWQKGSDAWEYPTTAFYCSVALLLRMNRAAALLSYLRANSHVLQGFDIMSGNWHRIVSDSPCLLTPVPCFIDHVGDESTLIEGRPDRNVVGRFTGFPGKEYSYSG